MSYVFDTSPLSTLHRNYYRSVFTTLWAGFDKLVEDRRILSTREVLREIRGTNLQSLVTWANDNEDIFPTPTSDEGRFVGDIFMVKHFQNNIEGKKLLNGGYVADPFVVARAAIEGAAVVSMETFKQNAADIPNICAHFNIQCLTLEKFMEAEGWKF